jgi:plastocyanin
MKKSFHIIAVTCLALLAPMGNTRTQNVAPADTSVLAGEIALISSDTGKPLEDASRAVVWLSPLEHAQRVRETAEKQQNFRVVQHNKKFEPSLLVVPVGSTVDFPNLDPWFHNVFSLYRGKRFDLGLYQAGSQKSVRFDRAGPSYLFCNIHPEMTGVILAVDSELFSPSDKAGHYSITGIPAGKYTLHVWYESAPPAALQALERLVVVEGEPLAALAISIPVNKPIGSDHKNKYGESYDLNLRKTDY